MRQNRLPGFNRRMEQVSEIVTQWSGTSAAFLVALALIILWLFSGPIFHFSDTWQLVINTTTTIITFLMVFLIQRAQNKEARAASMKLNELIASSERASNRLIDVESLSEKEIEALHKYFRKLVEMSGADSSLTQSHTVEEATERHEAKRLRRRPRGAGNARRGGARRHRNGTPENGPRTT